MFPELCEIQVVANSGGNKYNLSEACGYFLREIDGLGIAEVNRLFQKSPQQIGDTDLGFDQNVRFILGSWVGIADSNPNLWRIKELFLAIFRPRQSDDPTQLIFYFPDGTIRASDVHLEGELNFSPDGRLDGITHQAAVILRAQDPRLYDPRRKTFEFVFIDRVDGWHIETDPASAINPGWHIETDPVTAGANPGWLIGSSSIIIKQATLLYASGLASADIEFPVIYIFGPLINPIITNLTTGEALDFTDQGGLNIPVGGFVEIDLRFRSGKTIKDQDGNFVDQYLTDDSDLDSWHLSYNTEKVTGSAAPSNGRSDGNNLIQVSGLGADLDTRIQIVYYERYIGK